MRKIFLSLSIVTLLLLIGCNDSNEDTDSNEEKVTPVEVAKVKTGDFTVHKTLYGQTAPTKQMPVIMEQPGEVTSLKVKNGDQVKEDDHLATVKTAMGDQTIRASIDGVVASLQTTEGSMQSNEEPLLVIVDLDKLLIHYAVTANARELFKVDKEMEVSIDGTEYKATVTSVDTLPNETGQFTVDLELDNEDHDVLPGVPAKVLLTDKKVKDTNIIPSEAILSEGDEQFVFILRDDHVEKVVVEVKETQSEQTAVEAELAKDDQVVVNGQFTLTDDAKVEVTKEGK